MLEQLDLSDLTVIGNSFGGWLTAEIALRDSPRVSGAVIIDGIAIPVHVLWGESDRIVDPDYGRAYAAAIPVSTFTLLPRTSHLPQVETPEELLGALLDLGHR